MSVSLVCMSHTPLMAFNEPGPGVRDEVDAIFDEVRAFVKEVDPTLVISFGPDHFNGFFYDLMPPFAVCLQAEGVGDFDTAVGELNVPEQRAFDLVSYLAGQDLDVTMSRKAQLDHGSVQIPEMVLGGLDVYPIIPIFVNGVAPPFVSMKRIRLLGEAVGRWVQEFAADERVLVIGTGGLSHDPPVPRWGTATEQQRAFLLEGRNPTPEARATRQERTITTGQKFARGEADIMDLNPEWDLAFLDICANGDTAKFDAYQPDEMTAAAGNSSHEVRCWVGAVSAAREAGQLQVRTKWYKEIPEWIAGFGVLTATTA